MSIQVNKFLVSSIGISSIAIFTPLVQAREIKTQEDYRLYCGQTAYQYNVQSPDCPQLREIFEGQEKQQDEQLEFFSEPKRRNTKQKKESKQQTSGYIGITILGIYFPTDDFLGTGVGGSLFGGVKFNQFIGLDLELGGFWGISDDDDVYLVGYSFLNPRFFIPLSSESKDLTFYISPGIGFSQLIEEDFTDDVRLTWQIKGGVTFPIYKRLGGYGEVRYADQFSDEGSGAFGTEFGITLRL